MLTQDLVQVLTIDSLQERQATILSILGKYKSEAPYTAISIHDALYILQQQGINRIDAIEQCMKLCEDIVAIDMEQGLYSMIQLYVETINDYVHHIWDAVEFFLFENPRKSIINYLEYLDDKEQDLTIKSIYESWIIDLKAELLGS